MRNFPVLFAAILLLAGGADASYAQNAAAPAAAAESAGDPLADPRAMVKLGKARFTILTPELIRMEWAADGKFEDHASFVFVNRRLPVPAFEHSVTDDGHTLTIKTKALSLVYRLSPGAANQDGRFTPQNLTVSLSVAGKSTVWHPGLVDDRNLMGTAHTLDESVGDKLGEPIEPGLISREGWAVVDDSSRPLFDSADFRFLQGEKSVWPWVMQRPAGERQDWYFFGYGHDYKQALGDFMRVAGRIPLPPRFAFGTWWSRYWAYTDQEIEELVRGFHENDVPLDVFVIDMDWHPTFGTKLRSGAEGPVGPHQGLDAATPGTRCSFPIPSRSWPRLHADGPEDQLNLHPASGMQPWEDAYPAMAKAMGIDPATETIRALRHHRQEIRHELHGPPASIRWRSRASISGGSTGSRSPPPNCPA